MRPSWNEKRPSSGQLALKPKKLVKSVPDDKVLIDVCQGCELFVVGQQGKKVFFIQPLPHLMNVVMASACPIRYGHISTCLFL